MKDLQKLLIGTVILLILATASISLIAIPSGYNSRMLGNSTSQFSALNSTIEGLNSDLTILTNEVNGSLEEDTNEGVFGFIDGAFKSATASVKTVGRSSRFLTVFISSIGDYLPIPPVFTGLLITIVILIIGFSIWKAIFRVG